MLLASLPFPLPAVPASSAGVFSPPEIDPPVPLAASSPPLDDDDVDDVDDVDDDNDDDDVPELLCASRSSGDPDEFAVVASLMLPPVELAPDTPLLDLLDPLPLEMLPADALAPDATEEDEVLLLSCTESARSSRTPIPSPYGVTVKVPSPVVADNGPIHISPSCTTVSTPSFENTSPGFKL